MRLTPLALALAATLAVAACEEEVGDDATVIEEPADAPATPEPATTPPATAPAQ